MHGSLEGAIANAAAERPRIAATLRDQAAELAAFKEIATLQEVDLERPKDRKTDYTSAAAAARERGMLRLADRLDPSG